MVTQEANSGEYAWTVPLIDSSNCRISVEAVDNATNVGTDWSDANFTIDSGSPEVGSITLKDRTSGSETYSNELIISVEASSVTGSPDQMLVSHESDFAGATWQSFSATFEYTLPAGDGTQEVYYKVRDVALNESSSVSDTIIIDTTVPSVTVGQPNGGELLAGGATYEVTWEATDAIGLKTDPITIQYSTDEGSTWIEEVTNQANDGSYVWTVPGISTTEAKIKVLAEDLVGWVGSDESDAVFEIDSSSPEVGSITLKDRISGDTSYTREQTISVEASGVTGDPTQMLVSHESDFAGATWQSFSATFEYTLLAGEGSQTVYYKVRDVALNESTPESDNIDIDTINPTVTVEAPNGGEILAGGSQYVVTWEATDGGSGIASGTPITIRFTSNEGSSWTLVTRETNSGEYAWTVPLIDSITCRISVEAIDNATNIGTDWSDANFSIDSTSPEVGSITLRDRTNGSETYSNELTISVEASGITDNPTQMLVSHESNFAGASWQSFSATFEYTLPAGDGTQEVYYKVRDDALNESSSVSDTIIIDTTVPSVTVGQPNGGELLTGGATYEVTWEATDAIGLKTDPITIQYTTDEGSTWIEEATNQANDGLYVWTVPGVSTTEAKIKVLAEDLVGWIGSDESDAVFEIDSSSPEVGSITLKDTTTGSTTYSNDLTVSVEASGVSGSPTEMIMAQDSGFTSNSTGWISYNADTTYTLTAGEGSRTIYYKVRDVALNESAATNEAIFIDTIDPVVTIEAPDGGEIINGGSAYTITWEATDGGSGLASVTPITIRFTSNEGSSWPLVTQESNGGTYAWTVPLIDSSNCRISVEAIDNATNVGTDWSDANFTIDSSSPEVGSITLKDRTTGATDYTNEQIISVEASGVTGGPSEMLVSHEASFTNATWQNYSANFEYTLPTGDGTKEVYYKVRDTALNESSSVNNNIILDTTVPSVTVGQPNGGELLTGGATYEVTWEATDAIGLKANPITIQYSTDEGSTWIEEAANQANDGSYIWTVPGVSTTEAKIKVLAEDLVGWIGSDESDAVFEIDSGSPEVGSITLTDRTSGDTSYTREQTISVEASGVTGDPIQMLVSHESDFAGATWESFSATFEYTLPAGDGTKSLYYKVRDDALNESSPDSDSIVLDTSGPTSPSIVINSGAPATNEVNVALTLSANDSWTPIQVMISNEAGFGNATWESFPPTTKAWVLISGDGPKTVYAKFRDGGLTESTTAEDTITLDTIAPTVTVEAPNGGEIINGGSSYTITWEATDAGSGIATGTPISLYYSTNSGSSWTPITQYANTGTYLWSVPLINSTTCRISVEAVDVATNVGRDISDSDFSIDSDVPQVGSIEVRDLATGGTARTNNRVVSIEAFDVSVEATEMRIAEDASFTVNETIWLTYSKTTTYEVTSGDGTKNIYYKVRDAVLKDSNTVFDSIVLDTTGPTSPSIVINSGAVATNEVNVSLSLEASDSWTPLEMIISNEASFTNANWESYSTSKAWVLPAGDGDKTVYAKFRDAGSNESSATSDAITLDTIAPTVTVEAPNGGEIINGGSSYTITWEATDADSGIAAGTPIAVYYSTNSGSNWTLITNEVNDGQYSWVVPLVTSTNCRISIEAVDVATNVGSDMSDADFEIDSSMPTVTSIELRDRTSGDTSFTNERPITVEVWGVSPGVTEMIFAEDFGFSVNSTGWISFETSTEYTLSEGDGTSEVYCKVKKNVTQESSAVSDSIILDTIGPSPVSVMINSGALVTSEVNVSLSLSANDLWLPIQMMISNEAGFGGAAWEPYAATKAWTLAVASGSAEVFARFRDAGLNVSIDVSDDIYVDADSPTVLLYSPVGSNVALTSSVEVTFSEEMNKDSAEDSFSMEDTEAEAASPNNNQMVKTLTVVSGTFTWVGDVKLIFTPDVLLTQGTTYRVRLTDTAEDKLGNPLVPFTWQFTTASDDIGPTITNYLIDGKVQYRGDIIDSTPVISATILDEGSAVRIKIIRIYVNDDLAYSGTYLDWAGAVYDSTGYFSYTLPALAEGTYDIAIRAYDFADNVAEKIYEELHVYASPGVVGPLLNHPNPFSPLEGGVTIISFYLKTDADVALMLYDITGSLKWRFNASAGAETYPGSGVGAGGAAGYNEISWDGKSSYGEISGNGIYILKLVDIRQNKQLGGGKITVLD